MKKEKRPGKRAYGREADSSQYSVEMGNYRRSPGIHRLSVSCKIQKLERIEESAAEFICGQEVKTGFGV